MRPQLDTGALRPPPWSVWLPGPQGPVAQASIKCCETAELLSHHSFCSPAKSLCSVRFWVPLPWWRVGWGS